MITRLRVTIVGWYGTETIGDRAILAGIIRLLSKVASDIKVNLGSLYPVLTDRTIHEDGHFFELCAHKSLLRFNIFDSQSSAQLERNIRCSDVLIIGGGPLMDIGQMYMLEYAVKYAKRKKKKTVALGCGYGPLKRQDTIECANRILDNIDLSIMRDSNAPNATITNMVDPAVFACLEYLNHNTENRTNSFYAVNLRDIYANGNQYPVGKNLEERLTRWFSSFVDQCEKPIYMVPMHTFSVGFDDRIYLERMANRVQSTKVEIVSKPPSLWDTMGLFYNAELCVGMRFHAVVLQTILNGNNYILDYTHPEKGKIISLVRQLNMEDDYRGRYVSLSDGEDEIKFDWLDRRTFHFDNSLLLRHFSTYVDSLISVLS